MELENIDIYYNGSIKLSLKGLVFHFKIGKGKSHTSIQ
jgi:hypothetical protein